MNLHLNSSPRRGEPLSVFDRGMFGPGAIAGLHEFLAPLQCAVTPLKRMPALAQELRIGQLFIKDESRRSSLGSFKALGGAYAVIRLVLDEAERRLGRPFAVTAVAEQPVQEIAQTITVTCATDGNHGRSVAVGARSTGCRAVIFVHAGVSEARVLAMRQLGAQVERVNGTYDDAVAEAARAGEQVGWHVVADTSWPGYEHIPARVMQGYLLVADEALRQCHEHGGALPTHVFLQAGVGGFAAAMAAHMSLRMEESKPRFVIVEPDRAACLFASALAHAPTRIVPGEHTIMAMLECYEPSLIAWRILERLADAFVTIDDAAAVRTLRRLASPTPPDPFVESGESGGAGLAALTHAAQSQSLRQQLGLNENSVALVFNTEGATDPELYAALLAKK